MESPIDYWIDRTKSVAFIKYRAQPDFTQWTTVIGQLLEDPAYKPEIGLLFDRRDVPRPVNTDYIKRVVHFIDSRQATGTIGRCATVVSDLGSFGMGRMAEQITNYENSFRTFRTMAEAEQWLASGILVTAISEAATGMQAPSLMARRS